MKSRLPKSKGNEGKKPESSPGKAAQEKSFHPPEIGINFHTAVTSPSTEQGTSQVSQAQTVQLKQAVFQLGGSGSKPKGGKKTPEKMNLRYGLESAKKKFNALQADIWKQYIDLAHQKHDKLVYDTAAHRGGKEKDKEKGYIANMEAAHAYAGQHIGEKLDADSYDEIHARAMKHSKHVLKEGGAHSYYVNRLTANMANAKLHAELKEHKLVTIEPDPENDQLMRCVFTYGNGDPVLLKKTLNAIFTEFYTAIDQIKDPEESAAQSSEERMGVIKANDTQRIQLIAVLHKKLEYLHPYSDGNTRTNLVILNKVLSEYGFYPVIFSNPNDSYHKTNEEWAKEIEAGSARLLKEAVKDLKDDEDDDDSLPALPANFSFEAHANAAAAVPAATTVGTGTTTQSKSIKAPSSGVSFTIQKKENKTGLPDNLKSGIENLSGMDISDVKVHYNSPQPAQLNAHAFAQGNQIHVATGQEKHLAHEAWHVVQQKQGRVKPTKQLKSTVAINDDVRLEREADVMGAKAMQLKASNDPVSGKFSAVIPPYARQHQLGSIAQLARAPKGFVKIKEKQGRYPGHASAANKKALIEIAKHRQNKKYGLSHPETTAVKNSPNTAKPVTGRKNRTKKMPSGTAICHKISDKSIRTRIEQLFEKEKGNKKGNELNSFLQGLIKYINPSHISTDVAPKGGFYETQVKAKFAEATAAYSKMANAAAGSAGRLGLAHEVGAAVANSPVNLFLGDSSTNSSISARFDQNTLLHKQKRAPSPRSKRAEAKMKENKDWFKEFTPAEVSKGEPQRSSEP
jgi:hypothetical protein